MQLRSLLILEEKMLLKENGYKYRASEKRALCVPNQTPDTKMQRRQEGSTKLNQTRRPTCQFVVSVESLTVNFKREREREREGYSVRNNKLCEMHKNHELWVRL